MEEKIITYKGDEIKVTFDANRCIHSAECVRGLPSVFDVDKKPWIQPDNSSPDKIAEVIHRCPTGALQYERLDGKENESPPKQNKISLGKDGPVYMYGDIEIQNADGNVVLEDTRFALCRCGESSNKPACDNSHEEIEFTANESSDLEKFPETDNDSHGKLILKLMKNGPVLVEGTYNIQETEDHFRQSDKNMALCRCGSSSNKPFCDGTHKEIGFTTSE